MVFKDSTFSIEVPINPYRKCYLTDYCIFSKKKSHPTNYLIKHSYRYSYDLFSNPLSLRASPSYQQLEAMGKVIHRTVECFKSITKPKDFSYISIKPYLAKNNGMFWWLVYGRAWEQEISLTTINDASLFAMDHVNPFKDNIMIERQFLHSFFDVAWTTALEKTDFV